MANVKITDLTELSAADSAAVDVFPIVDIDADATKKITIASLRTTVAAANDFVTYTNITANVDIVQDNVAAGVVEATAIEARRVANIAGAVSTITTGNLTTGRAIISDGSGKIAVSPVTSTELGYVDGVTSAIQTQIDTKIATTDSASNDFITYTQLNANINLVQDNVASAAGAAAVEVRRVANIQGAVSTITTGNLTASRALVSDGSGKVAALASVTSTELAFLDATSSVQTQIDTKIATTASASNDFVTYTRLDANIDVVSANATAVETKRVANIAGAVSSITTADLTASRAVVSDGSGKIAVSAVTATELGYLDGVSSAIQTQLDTKGTTTEDTAIEARRVANIAGAVSTITTGNLTASKALVSDGSGKVSASAVTSTELGYVDGVTSAIQTQIDSKQATITGAATTIDDADLTASRALVSDGSGKVAVSAVTSTELGYVDGVTSALQTQLNDINTRATANAASSGAADAVEVRRVANIAGAVSTITTGNLTASRAVVSDGSGKVAISPVTSTEIGYLDGVSSAIQTQIDSKQATITGAATTIDDADLTASRAVVSDGSGKVAVSAVTSTEIGYLDGVSSAIQTQIDSKQATITGAATTIDDADLTVSRALVSDGSGKVAVSAVTSTEIGYLDGVSSAIQTQLNAKAPLAGATFTGQVNMSDDLVVTGNLTVNGDTTTVNSENKVIQDRFIMLANAVSGAPSADVGIFFNRGTSGNAAIYYDESAKFFTLSETRDPDSNIAISPTGAANLAVGQFTATSVKYNGADLNTAITDNRSGAVSTVYKDNLTASRAVVSDGSGKIAISAVTSTEIGYLDGVTSAIQTQIDSKQATITGAATTIDDTNLTASRAVVSDGSGKVAVSDVTSTELGYLDGVSSAIQTQLDTKGTTTEATAIEARRVANIAGAVSTITTGNLSASKALVSDGSGKVTASAVTSTELGYVDGVTSAIQTQIDSKQATITGAATTIDDADLTASRAIVSDGSGKVAVSAVTSTEVGYLDGVSSAIQTQLTAGVTESTAIEARRAANIAGAVSTITTGNLTASRAVVSDGSGKVAVSAVTATELGYVDGVTSAIQTQIDSKQATITGAATTIDDADLTASRALVSDGSGKVAVSAVTSTEVGYLDGVSSAIQTQLTAGVTEATAIEARRVANIAGAVSTITTGNLTTSRALASDGSGKVAVGSTTTTELNQLNAITRGSLIYGNASGATARLAAGGADQVLTSDGTDIAWADAAGGGGLGYSTNTTVLDPPGTTNTDLGNLTDASTDAFGVQSTASYDLMDPRGQTVSLDLGAL